MDILTCFRKKIKNFRSLIVQVQEVAKVENQEEYMNMLISMVLCTKHVTTTKLEMEVNFSRFNFHLNFFDNFQI